METVTLRGHYDGVQIRLDEPFELKPNAKLLITVIEPDEDEREAWFKFSAEAFAAGYEDEPEYPLSAIKEWNPDYERG